MARHKVFICYSHQDAELFQELLTQLDPLEHQDLLEVWTDQQIMAGEDWEPRIYRAIDQADAAVVLVSPDLLASDFVRDHEIPRLLAARAERGLHLAPLFLRPANADLLSFTVETADGPRKITLKSIQGLNLPSKPVTKLGRAARDEALANAARRILEILGAMPEVRPPRPRRELTAALELRGGQIVRRYGQPPYFDLHSSRGPLDLRRLENLAARSQEELGRELLEVVLGPERERTAVLSQTYGREVPNPLRHAFRVRVQTDDAALRALPWPLCRWRKHLLVDEGWTFELTASDRPRPVEHLHTPCRALMVAAEPTGLPALLVDAHARSLESLLGQVWGLPLKATLLHRARTPAELEDELASPPDLVYVYGHARAVDAGLEILLATAEGRPAAVAFAHLAELLARRPPRVVVVNTLGECPLVLPLPGAAALLHLRHPEIRQPEDSGPSRMAAAVFWKAVLGTGLHPEQAFSQLRPAIRRHGAITTDYHDWTLDHSEYVPKVDRPRAHLDRRRQRRVVLEAVEELARKPKRRVTCLVAYGAEGNLVEHFAVQMLATVKERATDLARLEHHRLELPPERDGLGRALIEESFRDVLGLQPSDPLAAAFRHTRRGGPRARPMHLLDWGTYGGGHSPPLTAGHLETWLGFCRDDLEGACPPDARILAYLGLVSDEARHSDIENVIAALRERSSTPSATCNRPTPPSTAGRGPNARNSSSPDPCGSPTRARSPRCC